MKKIDDSAKGGLTQFWEYLKRIITSLFEPIGSQIENKGSLKVEGAILLFVQNIRSQQS